MRGSIVTLMALLMASAPVGVAGQSENATAGWIGLMITPVGGMAPTLPASVAANRPPTLGFQGRYAHWQFADDDDNTTTLAGSVILPAGPSTITVEVGRTMVKDCDDCGRTIFGVDAYVPMWSTPTPSAPRFSVGAQPALGFMTQDGFSALSGAVSLPVSIAIPLGHTFVTPFIAPGFGFARLAEDEESASGARIMLGGGAAVTSASGRIQLTVSARRVFIDEEGIPNVVGLALSFHP